MKNKNFLLKNIIYTWKKVKDYKESKLYFLSLGIIFLSVIIPFLTMALPSVVIWLLIKEVYFLNTLMIIMVYALLLLILNYLNTVLDSNSKISVFTCRLKAGYDINHKILTTDFVNIDRQHKKTEIEKALIAVYQNDDIGFPALLEGSRSFIINIMLLILYVFFAAKLNFFIMILLIISPVISMYAHSKNIKWLMDNDNGRGAINKKIRYLRTQSIDLKNGKDIRLYKIQNWFVDLYYSLVNLYVNWYQREYRRYFFTDLLGRFMSCIQNIIVYGYLLYNVMNGMDIASFVLYLGVVSGIGGFIKVSFDKYAYMQKNNIHVQNYLNFMSSQEFSNRDDGIKPEENTTHELRFENISFKYPDSDENLLDNLNLTIKKGEKLAIVGENGAGKTTLIKILCGLYQPDSGNIFIDNINSKDINIYDYYKIFSVVFQDIFAIAYTIAQNIACTSNDNIDYEKLNKYIKLAGLEEKINSLPKKEQTDMLKEFDDDGIVFSGGEMQKLMLARALYKDSAVIILDEPTAALDPIAESEMYEKYNTLINDKTSIFISHRLSSTRFCDRILFMKNGKIVETGTHDELMKLGKEYAKMFEIQAHYYQKEVC